MENLTPVFIDITKWHKIPYSSTGGTRAKNIYVFPEDQKEYFFKGSKKLKNGKFKYPTEFWSEIVASKVGQMLGFNLLDYDIGFDENDEQQIGCLSKSMVEHTENKLSEGVDFLRGFDSSYNPRKDETRYTLEFIKNALTYFELSEFTPHFIEMLIFDAIIGNSDRHQENWGFISKFRETIQEIDKEITNTRGFFARIEPKIRKFITKSALKRKVLQEQTNIGPNKILLKTQSQIVETVFSPIYDSGCCLGRELEDEKINLMLKDSQMLNAFIKRGRSEVRWNIGKKPKHFDFLKEISREYPEIFKKVLEKIESNYNKENLKLLIDNIDVNLPSTLKKFSLPINRKLLMYKLVTLRVEKLFELI
ncbi:hypothetical protein [Pontimicrobium sp. IMCC45349]|uniref:hypothetical protein n=1 Tax=Pontimicrobium sp. IMCC45349 TaxID=3391574 RepID=UPI0039A0F6C7